MSPEFGGGPPRPPSAPAPEVQAEEEDSAPPADRLAPTTRMALIESFRAAAVRAAERHGVTLRQTRVFRPLRVSDSGYAGLAATLVVVLVAIQGWLYVPEQWVYDLRTQFVQFGRPAPTDRLVHLDLDDRSVEDIGRWPWSRSTQAMILRELAAAKPKAVALDILYDRPEKTTYEPSGEEFVAVDHDGEFARALAELGNVILAFSHSDIESMRPDDVVYGKIVNLLLRNPAMEPDQVRLALPADERSKVEDHYYPARREAVGLAVTGFMTERVRPLEEIIRLIESGAPPPGTASKPTTAASDTPPRPTTARAVVAPAGGTGVVTGETPLRRIVSEAWRYEMSRRAVAASRIPAPPGVLEQFDDRQPQILPLAEFAQQSAAAAFVTYNKGGDGIMRRVPLVMNSEGQASMSLGLALALKALDVRLQDVEVRSDSLRIPTRAGVIEVPMRAYRFSALTRETDGVLDIPFIGRAGGSEWLAMYDPPGASGADIRHTLSISRVWQSVQLRSRIAANNLRLREAVLTLYGQSNTGLDRRTWDPYDAMAWTREAKEILELTREDLASLADSPPSEPPALEAGADAAAVREHEDAVRAFRMVRAAAAAEALLREMPLLARQADEVRRDLRERLEGKAVLVGWTATGRTDFVATPMHPACAGVRIHGLVFNAIVSQNFLRFAPEWLGWALTLVLGLVTTLAVVKLSPPAALTTTALLTGAYTGLNALLFGPYGFVLMLAPPLFAVASAWATTSVAKFVVERAERNRILKRFQTYVDPQLVNYLLQNPERAGLEGERRMMTVCFTDLAGFTTLSERLGEQTVGMLNEYFALMVPLVRKHQGYVNKLLGDGMMFFFNAPQPNLQHASSAFDAVLEMQQVMHDFNQGLEDRGLPTLKMRVGITTGEMIAGDAGGGGYNDFTVLGDVVNLSSRLEGANKASGTLILCNRAALEAAGGDFLTRPIGMLRVVGKTEGIETFELMCRREKATEKQLRLARLTESLVYAYRRADLDACMRFADQMDESFGPTKVADLYRGLCNAHMLTGVPEGFDGTIILESK
jgi:class 3 adenylate cyclase/CHASE2 domain-containing sensor protein